MFFERFCQPACFVCCSIYFQTAQNSREECNEFADLLFFRLSVCFSRDSLSCHTRSLARSLYFIQVYIFIPLIHSAPFLRAFHTFYFTPILFLCILPNILLIPDDAFARNLIIIFNFRSQRRHLNYIFLSNVYSFDTMEFSFSNSLIIH